MPQPLAALLSKDNLAFIQQGLSITLASRDARLAPSLTRALGCRVADCGNRLRLTLARPQSVDLLRDVERFDVVAVVFTEPTTHRTLQIKGSDIRVVAADDADRARLAHNHQAFAVEIGQLGFDAAFTARLYAAAPEDLVALDFRPDAVFQQTPGPHAGEPLAANP